MIEVDKNRVVLIFVIDFLIQQFFVVVVDKVLDHLMKMLILKKEHRKSAAVCIKQHDIKIQPMKFK